MPSSPTEGTHVTVLLREAVEALNLRAGGIIVDGTFGGGGHSARILAHEPPVARLIAFDADLAARERASVLAALLDDPARFVFVHDRFANMRQALAGLGIEQVHGILLDLGVSSYQLDQAERGFAFRFEDAPLDMRFDQASGETAADLLVTRDADDLTAIFSEYGEEPQARSIARAIVRQRAVAPLRTAADLVRVVTSVTGPARRRGIHPATRVFQALRIAVNREIEQLETLLADAGDLLAPGGRLVVLSFHSLEDRPVKRFIERASASCICPPEQPICICDHLATFRRIGKPVRASAGEIERNPRARSVVMRVAERLSLDESLAMKRTLRTRD